MERNLEKNVDRLSKVECKRRSAVVCSELSG